MAKQIETETRSVVGLRLAIVAVLALGAGGAFLVAHWLFTPAPVLVPLSPTRVGSQSSPTTASSRELERPEPQALLDRSTPAASSEPDLLATDTLGATPAFDPMFDSTRKDRERRRAGNPTWLKTQRLLDEPSHTAMFADLQKMSESLRDEQSTENPTLRGLLRKHDDASTGP